MKQFLLALLFIPTLLFAQKEEDQRYLEGAVTLEDGKVTFSRNIEVPSLSPKEIFLRLSDWGNTSFNTENSRVLYKNDEKGEIAIAVEEYLVFSKNFIALDRSLIRFNLIAQCSGNDVSLIIKGIRYEYMVSYQKEPVKYTAEKWITDEYALNKKKDKLYRNNGKFRIATIDYVNNIFESAEVALGLKRVSINPLTNKRQVSSKKAAPSEKENTAPTQTTPKSNDLEGFVHFEPSKVPSTIADMLPENKVLLLDSSSKHKEQEIQWKGIGTMFGKKITTISLSKDSRIFKSISSTGLYRLHFCKPGTEENTPWLIMECAKQGETEENNEVILIGEIINVWIK